MNYSFSNYGTHQKCKGRLILFKVSHIKYQDFSTLVLRAYEKFVTEVFIYSLYRIISIIGAMSSDSVRTSSILHSNPNFSIT